MQVIGGRAALGIIGRIDGARQTGEGEGCVSLCCAARHTSRPPRHHDAHPTRAPFDPTRRGAGRGTGREVELVGLAVPLRAGAADAPCGAPSTSSGRCPHWRARWACRGAGSATAGAEGRLLPGRLAAPPGPLRRRPPDVVHVRWSLCMAALQARGCRWPTLPTTSCRTPPRPATRGAMAASTRRPTRLSSSDRSARMRRRASELPPSRLALAPHGPLLEEEPVLPPSEARRGARPAGDRSAHPLQPPGVRGRSRGWPRPGQRLPAGRDGAGAAGAVDRRSAERLGRGPPVGAGAAELTNRDSIRPAACPAPISPPICAPPDVVALPYREVTTSGMLMRGAPLRQPGRGDRRGLPGGADRRRRGPRLLVSARQSAGAGVGACPAAGRPGPGRRLGAAAGRRR